jgi:hypothetical protein
MLIVSALKKVKVLIHAYLMPHLRRRGELV